MSQIVKKAAEQTFREVNAVVISAGLMEKTVKARVAKMKWNSHIKKVCTVSLYILGKW